MHEERDSNSDPKNGLHKINLPNSRASTLPNQTVSTVQVILTWMFGKPEGIQKRPWEGSEDDEDSGAFVP